MVATFNNTNYFKSWKLPDADEATQIRKANKQPLSERQLS